MSPSVEVAMERLTELRIVGLGSGDVLLTDSGDTGVRGAIEATDADWLHEVRVRPDDARESLLIDFPRDRFGRSRRVRVDLFVPAGVHAEVESGSGDVTFRVATGRTRVTCGSGGIALQEVGDVECTSGSGGIQIGSITGPNAHLRSGSGDIQVTECTSGIRAKSGSGDIVVRTLHADLAASSGSGDISVPSTTGSVDLRTASGSLSVGVADGLPAWLDLTSVSGRIDITLPASREPAQDEPYVSISGRTASGDIDVHSA